MLSIEKEGFLEKNYILFFIIRSFLTLVFYIFRMPAVFFQIVHISYFVINYMFKAISDPSEFVNKIAYVV